MFDFTSLDLNFIWLLLIGVLFAGYAMLDGFDLGVGALHLLTRTDRDRRLVLNSIGPVWDGNEVWLVTGGGALFAAFPPVYATLTSGFYMAVMLLLACLIFRAVSIEFRSKRPGALWRSFWDTMFSASSVVASLILGVALGNLIRGVPLTAGGEFAGNFWTLVDPFTLLMGVTTVALFAMHGSIFLVLKTEGELHERIRGWVKYCMITFIVCFAALTMTTLVYLPHMTEPFRGDPFLFAIPVATILAIANIPRAINERNDAKALSSSCATMAAMLCLAGIGMFPDLVRASNNPDFSLTIYNASASVTSMNIMLNIAILGIPVVLAYTISIYWVFRGKVQLTEDSY